eukprot:jgi/Astpho2/4544/e_gw1.00067.193.1_t
MGSCGLDYLAQVAAWPEPDQKLRTERLEMQGGGNCGNALTAVARMGVRAALVSKIGSDGISEQILAEFEREGVDTQQVLRAKGPSPFTYIIVDRAGGTRTCIHTPSEPFHPSEMDAATCTAVLDGASLVYFDGRLTEAAVLLARAARSAGVPVLVEAERLRPSLEQLLAEADFVCTSAHFPQEWTGAEDVGPAMLSVLRRLPRTQWLLTTLGTRGSILLERQTDEDEGAGTGSSFGAIMHGLEAAAQLRDNPQASYLAEAAMQAESGTLLVKATVASSAKLPKERVEDTTGAGDAFIGSMLVGIITGMSKADSLRLAATVAALKCTALGARPGLPHRDALEGLL